MNRANSRELIVATALVSACLYGLVFCALFLDQRATFESTRGFLNWLNLRGAHSREGALVIVSALFVPLPFLGFRTLRLASESEHLHDSTYGFHQAINPIGVFYVIWLVAVKRSLDRRQKSDVWFSRIFLLHLIATMALATYLASPYSKIT